MASRWTTPSAADCSTCPARRRGSVAADRAHNPRWKQMPTRQRRSCSTAWRQRNGTWFDIEMDKLDRWAEDRRASLKAELDELDETSRRQRRRRVWRRRLPEKLERQRERPPAGGQARRGMARLSMRRAGRSTARKMRCWMRSAGGWSSGSNKSRSSPCGGEWSDCAKPVQMVTFTLL